MLSFLSILLTSGCDNDIYKECRDPLRSQHSTVVITVLIVSD